MNRVKDIFDGLQLLFQSRCVKPIMMYQCSRFPAPIHISRLGSTEVDIIKIGLLIILTWITMKPFKEPDWYHVHHSIFWIFSTLETHESIAFCFWIYGNMSRTRVTWTIVHQCHQQSLVDFPFNFHYRLFLGNFFPLLHLGLSYFGMFHLVNTSQTHLESLPGKGVEKCAIRLSFRLTGKVVTVIPWTLNSVVRLFHAIFSIYFLGPMRWSWHRLYLDEDSGRYLRIVHLFSFASCKNLIFDCTWHPFATQQNFRARMFRKKRPWTVIHPPQNTDKVSRSVVPP